MIDITCKQSMEDNLYDQEYEPNSFIINSTSRVFAEEVLGKYAFKFEVASFKCPELLVGGIIF